MDDPIPRDLWSRAAHLLVAVSLCIVGLVTSAHSQLTRCPKDSTGVGTQAGDLFQGKGLELNIEYCAVSRGDEDPGFSMDYVWPRMGVVAPVFQTKTAVAVGGLVLPAGVYSLCLLPSLNGWKLIVSKRISPFEYDESQVVGRVAMTPSPRGDTSVDKLKVRIMPTPGKSCSGRCDPQNGPYVPAEELGQPQIHFTWGHDDVYVVAREIPR